MSNSAAIAEGTTSDLPTPITPCNHVMRARDGTHMFNHLFQREGETCPWCDCEKAHRRVKELEREVAAVRSTTIEECAKVAELFRCHDERCTDARCRPPRLIAEAIRGLPSSGETAR